MLDKFAHSLDKAFCVDNCYNLRYHLYYKWANYQKVDTSLTDVIKMRDHLE